MTYDQKTIPPLLVYWAERGVDHIGVILCSPRTIPTGAVGAIARALVQIWHTHGVDDWTNRVAYLTRGVD